ncbi:MAG: basic amino acid ABC transporter substrate-binding protein [Bacillota bacterium]|jgi:polar amino acid transport system substrate-binding protein|nr:basic amino acid ABC transporter substrate-binding protein [Bacillota bacterium]HHT90505.1 basic amino acid ABC transporter substrate-binding protein [Bacillota bacterium]
MKKAWVLVLTVLLSLGTSSLVFGSEVLKVATEAGFMPFEFVSENTDELLGFDMDLIRAVGEVLDMDVQIDNISWDGLIPALLNNNYDLVIAGVTITPERQANVNFSIPYFESVLTIVKKQEDDAITSLDDLEGQIAAVQINTTGDFVASDLADAGQLKSVSRFDMVADAMQAVIIGVADVVVIDLPVAEAYLEANPAAPLQTVGAVADNEYYGIAINKKNVELLEKINGALLQLQEDGTYDLLFQKWFGAN